MSLPVILHALTIFVLNCVPGNSEHVFQWNLACYNQTSSAHNLRVAFSRTGTDSGSCLKQRHVGPGHNPHGPEKGNRDLCINNVSVVALTDRLMVDKPLLFEVSGGLVDLPGQLTGLLQLGKENVSSVCIKFDWNPDDQGIHKAPVVDNGRFKCCIVKRLSSDGLCGLNVTVYSRISTCAMRLHNRSGPSWRKDLDIMLSTEDHPVLHCALPRTADMTQMGTRNVDDFVQTHIHSIRIYTEKQAYATGANISFLAVTEEPDPLELHWQFGDNVTVITTSRHFIKSYALPDRYNVTVSVSNGRGSACSPLHRVVVQRAVQVSRLQYSLIVEPNTTLQITCFLTTGTDVTHLWDFGDGVRRFGQGTVHHVYNRTGEFIVGVTVSNLVSSATSQGHLFVVSDQCQPPPVKNMGPSRIQVWRSQPVHLSVSYDAPLQCPVSRGLLYSWSLYDHTGQQLRLPLTDTTRQHLHLPEYFLYYGTYTAVAKVRTAGSIVYSNYTVQMEVRSSPPVSFISGATHLFMSRHNSSTLITLDGRGSHDPDFPDSVMSYSWKCVPVNTAKGSCFTGPVPSSCAVLAFPARALIPGCDLFKFTLTVQSGQRSASSDVFITVRSKPSRIIQMSCKECRRNAVDWNEHLSVTAACGSCPGNVAYSWRLFLVNASRRATPEVPVCGGADVGLLSSLSQQPVKAAPAPALPVNHTASGTAGSALSKESSIAKDDVAVDKAVQHGVVNPGSGQKAMGVPPQPPALQLPLAEEEASPRLLSRWAGSPRDPPGWEGSLEHWGSSDLGSALDYEDFYSGIEEADPGEPLGRPTGPYGLDGVIQQSDLDEGDNVVGPGSVGRIESEKTLLDLHRDLIQPVLLESFTSTVSGTASSVITFKPSVLKPKSLYMLEVSASVPAGTGQVQQGKAQLFLPTRAALEGVACRVQPTSGLEVHSHFSVFCSTGQQDLIYEYSFSVGNAPRKLLYQGRDYQHYFNLPSGDPHNDYQVTILIIIGDRFGAVSRLCPVNVTVLPSFQRTSSPHSNPDEELFVYGLGNLTNLIQTRNDRDIIHYVSLLTGVLNRLSLDPESSLKLQTRIRTALISAGCQVAITSQDLLIDAFRAVSDLTKVSNQVTFDSAKLVTEHIRQVLSLRTSSQPHGALGGKVVQEMVLILSRVLEVSALSSTLGIRLTQDALRTTSEAVLMYMQSSKDSQYSVNSTFMRLIAWHHSTIPTPVKTINVTTFYIPNMLETDIKRGSSHAGQRPCFFTQLTSYQQNPYHWSRTSEQLTGDVADIRVFNCTTRREIIVRRLSAPLVIELQKHERSSGGGVGFTLEKREVNIHHFSITSQLHHKALQVTVEFRRPSSHTFPILLLFRIHKRPTPTLYNVQEVYRWKGRTAQIFLPPLTDSGTGYLMLLNANYNKSSRNRYTSQAVNYTLHIQGIQCLAWDGITEWRPEDCVLHGFTSTKVNCSCTRLSTFTVSYQTIPSTLSVANVTEYTSVSACLMPCVMMAVCTVVYVVLLVISKDADGRTDQTTGPFFLPDNQPSDHFLYTVTTDTGLRSAAIMTAKVYIVLYGENGVSQTRELSSPDHKFFTCNSRNTFILSAPQSLGRVWQVHLWHDCGGTSPSWFLSRVVVRDVVADCSWLFPGQCWLAVDEGDGRVERRLLALEQALPFREVLSWNLMECLEDFHPWLSAYSRPSYSAHTHVQRLSVCFLHLLAYMCANAMLLHFHHDQDSSGLGLIDVSPVSMTTGLCGLVLLPLGSLVSCLFRISKTNKTRSGPVDHNQSQLPRVCSVEDHQQVSPWGDGEAEPGPMSSQNLPWMQNAWTKKSEQSVQDRMTPGFESCTKQADCPKLQRSADSSSGIEVIEENVLDGSDKLQSRRSTCSSFDLRSSLAVKASSTTHNSFRVCSSLPVWPYYTAWTLWLCLSLSCIVITGTLGLKFRSADSVLWVQAVFFSLLFCVFAVHPAVVFMFAVSLSLWSQCSSASESAAERLNRHRPDGASSCLLSYQQPEVTKKHFEKVLAARQRARFLRLVRPPTSTELKCVRWRIRQRTLLRKTIRTLVLHMIGLSIVGFVVYGKNSSGQFQLNQALRNQFTWASHSWSPPTHKLDAWWNWTASSLLDELYLCSPYSDGTEGNAKTLRGAFYLIGEPVITMMEYAHSSSQMDTVCSPAQRLLCSKVEGPVSGGPTVSSGSRPCGKLGCYTGPGISECLGKNRSEASRMLRRLRAAGWMDRHSHTTMVQFTLYSPPHDLFSTVTLLSEQPIPGSLVSSSFIRSARLGRPAAVLGDWVVAAELGILFLTLLQLGFLTCAVTQTGWPYWTNIQNSLEVIIVVISLTCFSCTVYHSTLKEDKLEKLQRDNYKTFVDLSLLSLWEQFTRVIYGILLFLLLIKCCFLLRVHEAMDSAASSMTFIFRNMLGPLIAGVILIIAFSCLGNLLFHSSSSVFSTLSRSVYVIISRSCGVAKLTDLHCPHHVSLALCGCAALLCIASIAITGAITFFVKTAAKSKRRKAHVSVSELLSYIRDMFMTLAGKGRVRRSDYNAHTNNLFLDEFEDLIDELLFRLSAVSDGQDPLAVEEDYQSFICSAHHYSSEVVVFPVDNTVTVMRAEGSCVSGVSPCPPEDRSVRSQLEWKTLQRFHQSRGIIHIRDAPAETSAHSQTSFCRSQVISVQIECGNTPNE
ncbi:polycystin-1-like protein 1 isoform X2 [Brachyhypopomus gauderio]|uniref:polycystin-1-like protein 1 isoform X2 n=1 Tax=Brachyhypopomus gauderio TaxID=698409 RepID=UPI0040425B2B